jgi:hypothetical protein
MVLGLILIFMKTPTILSGFHQTVLSPLAVKPQILVVAAAGIYPVLADQKT